MKEKIYMLIGCILIFVNISCDKNKITESTYREKLKKTEYNIKGAVGITKKYAYNDSLISYNQTCLFRGLDFEDIDVTFNSKSMDEKRNVYNERVFESDYIFSADEENTIDILIDGKKSVYKSTSPDMVKLFFCANCIYRKDNDLLLEPLTEIDESSLASYYYFDLFGFSDGIICKDTCVTKSYPRINVPSSFLTNIDMLEVDVYAVNGYYFTDNLDLDGSHLGRFISYFRTIYIYAFEYGMLWKTNSENVDLSELHRLFEIANKN